MEFLSLSRRRSSVWNVPSGEEGEQMAAFAGYGNGNSYKDLFFVYLQPSVNKNG